VSTAKQLVADVLKVNPALWTSITTTIQLFLPGTKTPVTTLEETSGKTIKAMASEHEPGGKLSSVSCDMVKILFRDSRSESNASHNDCHGANTIRTVQPELLPPKTEFQKGQTLYVQASFTRPDKPQLCSNVKLEMSYTTAEGRGVVIGAKAEALNGRGEMSVVDGEGFIWNVTNCQHRGANGTNSVSAVRVQNNFPQLASTLTTAQMWENAKDKELADGLGKMFVFSKGRSCAQQNLEKM